MSTKMSIKITKNSHPTSYLPANLTKGAAGPSGLDANQYRRILCSKQLNREEKVYVIK